MSDRPAGGVTPGELGQSEERRWKGLMDRTASRFLGAEGRPWAIPMVWVSRADDGHPVVGPCDTVSRLQSLSHVLSRPSFLAAVVSFPSHWQLREQYRLSPCGSRYCRLPWQTGPRGWNGVTLLNARSHGQMSPCGWLTMSPYAPSPLGLRLCGLVLYCTYGWLFSVAAGGLKA